MWGYSEKRDLQIFLRSFIVSIPCRDGREDEQEPDQDPQREAQDRGAGQYNTCIQSRGIFCRGKVCIGNLVSQHARRSTFRRFFKLELSMDDKNPRAESMEREGGQFSNPLAALMTGTRFKRKRTAEFPFSFFINSLREREDNKSEISAGL